SVTTAEYVPGAALPRDASSETGAFCSAMNDAIGVVLLASVAPDGATIALVATRFVSVALPLTYWIAPERCTISPESYAALSVLTLAVICGGAFAIVNGAEPLATTAVACLMVAAAE